MKAAIVSMLLASACLTAWAQEANPLASTSFPAAATPVDGLSPPWADLTDARETPHLNHVLRGGALAGGISQFRALQVGHSRVTLRARVVDVLAAPGCGFTFMASPVMYEVLEGPGHLQGLRIVAQVPCIEMPLIEGDVAKFERGATHDIIVSGSNPYPAMSHDGDIYLLSAVLAGESVIDPHAGATIEASSPEGRRDGAIGSE